MKKQASLLFIFCTLTSMAVLSQNSHPITISGKVNNQLSGEPIPASIRVKNSNMGVAADSKGIFHLSVASLPVTLLITATGFEQQEINVENKNETVVNLVPAFSIIDEVVLRSKGIPTKIIDAPFSAEFIGLKQIRQLPTTSIYDATAYKTGIDLTTSSLTFKTPSSRGFNGSGSTRVNQIVDGMDNQAPGLNFFVGNFTGPTDLDIESIELLPGASSALYGPGGMNGTILINSKNPFKYNGLSVAVRQGIMHVDKSQRANASAYNDYSLRWAKVINNKFAFKIGVQYISAKDWLANDSTNYDRSGTSGKLIPGNRKTDPNYDGVNVYGDETSVDIYPFLVGALGAGHPWVEHIDISRTGYDEKDVIDPQTKNIKLSGALHYKFTNNLEGQLKGYWSTGNTVYTDDNRYALKGIKIGQYKFELKHKDWFLRSYTTQENAGEAYSATVATQYLNEAWKRSFNPANISGSWYPQFTGAYLQARAGGADKMTALYLARGFADQGRPEAGSTQFKQLFDHVRKIPIPNGGLFREQSQLWMTEGQYSFSRIKFVEIIAGASYKKYILNSDGTLFIDTAKAISINEIGAYAQITKKLFDDKLRLVASGRFDKNENFKAQFTPRFAALIKLAKDNNLRMSYQTAYRFPGNLAQWIRLDVGGDYLLLGGLPWVMNYMNADKNPVYQIKADGSIETKSYVYKEFKPETMRSFEVGYKSYIKNKLLIDAYAYFGKYEDFIGRIGLYQPATNEAFSITVNSTNKVKTHGFGLGLDYRFTPSEYSIFFNIYSDVITNVPAGFKAYFNAPKYRLNAGFANSGLGKSKRVSFNVMMRWQDSFMWEGELANGPVKSFTTVDAQVSYKLPKIKSMLRLGGTNITNHYYQNAYANPKIGAVYYLSYAYNIL
jgi:outer membrane receptor protein involved in Fe transport